MNPPIIATLTAINSRRDKFGNCCWALSYLDHHTGKQVNGTVSGGESNISSIQYELNGGSFEPRNVYFQTKELPIREFNRLTKEWKHAGCVPAELAKFIKEELNKTN